jgi:hypothetical protein
VTDDHGRVNRPRWIEEWFCDEPSCEFYGRPTQQGVCHTAEGELVDYDKLIDYAQRSAEETLRVRREHYPSDEEYIPWLEAHYECAMINWTFSLDECVTLRREVALLKLRLERYEPKP